MKNASLTASIFDRVASEYDAFRLPTPERVPLLLTEMLGRRPNLVVDLGAGTGLSTMVSIIVKQPQDGAGIPFHQDGKTHPEVRRRGLNVGIYLQPATEDNGCLRVVPGSHLTGVVDVRAMREQSGPVLPGSVPLEVDADCIAVHDRTLIHGSLPNTSPDLRITVYFGYHSLASIEPIHDADHITRRAQLVTLCVEERRASGWFPDETPYDYALSERAPQLSTEKERTEILRTPALAL